MLFRLAGHLWLALQGQTGRDQPGLSENMANVFLSCLPLTLFLFFLCCLVLASKSAVRTPATRLEGPASLSPFAGQVNRRPVGTLPQEKGNAFLAAPAPPHTGGLHLE